MGINHSNCKWQCHITQNTCDYLQFAMQAVVATPTVLGAANSLSFARSVKKGRVWGCPNWSSPAIRSGEAKEPYKATLQESH